MFFVAALMSGIMVVNKEQYNSRVTCLEDVEKCQQKVNVFYVNPEKPEPKKDCGFHGICH